MMKTKLFAMFCMLFLCLMENTYANCRNCEILEEGVRPQKIYIVADQITFFDSKIYVNLGGNVFDVPAVYTDREGLYTYEKQPRGRCEPYEWKCPKRECGRCNDFAYNTCPSCGAEMP